MTRRLYGSVICWEGWQFAVLSSAVGVCRIDLHGTLLAELSSRLRVRVIPDDRRNAHILQELHEYLAGQRKSFSCTLDFQGTPFQMSVWNTLSQIPYGKTMPYGEIAVAIGRPHATRAVGGAVGANPIPIVIPCHRVIGKDGSLIGYGGGLPLKERLLALEQGSLDL